MEWSDVRIFLAIAREGTLGAAARKLGLTQPTMGRRLKAFEEALGQKLFQRTNDGFILTDEGRLVLPHAERIEEEVDGFQRQLSGQSHHLDGTLRISCSDWFGIHILSPMLAVFHKSYPNVVVEVLTDARLLNLSRREADLVFRMMPFTEPDVVSRKLMRVEYGVYMSADAFKPDLGDGSGFRLVTMDEGFGGMPDVAWLKKQFPKAAVSMRSNNRDVQAALCAGGTGLAVVPRLLGDKFPGLRRLDLPEPPPFREQWIGFHRDLRRLPRLRALVDSVVEQCAGGKDVANVVSNT